MRILIETVAQDEHAACLMWGMERRGHEVDIFLSSHFPGLASISLHYDGQSGVSARSSGKPTVTGDYDVGILRRRRNPVLSPATSKADKDFALSESRSVLDCVSNFISVKKLWINSPDSRLKANSKPLQLKLAIDAGLLVPPTIISNNPDEVMTFFADRDGAIAIKSLRPTAWSNKNSIKIAFTNTVSMKDLSEKRLAMSLSPTIYQTFIDKSYEVRAMFMGKTYLAARLDTPSDPKTKTDWRAARAYGQDVVLRRVDLPVEVQRACLRLMEKLGIVCGSFDFIVDKDDRLWFLEVNPMGQFLWLDKCPEIPVLSVFMDFIESANPDFIWNEKLNDDLRFSDFIEAEVEQKDVYERAFGGFDRPADSFTYPDI